MKNKKKTLSELLPVNTSKKKYRIRLAETEEAEKEIKEFDRYEPIQVESDENIKAER